MLFVPTDRSVLITPPTEEPLTLDQVKLRAGQDWPVGDPRDALVMEYLAAARDRVEKDTGLALIEQTRDFYADSVDGAPVYGVRLGSQGLPLKSVTAVSVVNTDGTLTDLDPAGYTVDRARGRIALTTAWTPSPGSLTPGLVVRASAGWSSAEALAFAAPGLVHAVGLLAVHYFTAGRDIVNVGHIVQEVPYGYDDALAGFRQVSVV